MWAQSWQAAQSNYSNAPETLTSIGIRRKPDNVDKRHNNYMQVYLSIVILTVHVNVTITYDNFLGRLYRQTLARDHSEMHYSQLGSHWSCRCFEKSNEYYCPCLSTTW